MGARLPPLPSDGCPPLALVGGPDPAPGCFGRREHLLLCRFWQRNSPVETHGDPGPLREHKLPGDGHESQVAGHTGKLQTTREEGTKGDAGATPESTAGQNELQKTGAFYLGQFRLARCDSGQAEN